MASKVKKAMVYSNGELKVVSWEGDSYNFLRKAVGGYIERVPLNTFENNNIDIWCDEEGKLKNLKPSILLSCDGKIYDYLSGDVVFTRSNKNGNTLGLTDKNIEFIREQFDGVYSINLEMGLMLPVLFYN